MPNRIRIEGLKHIQSLVFDIPGSGVHLLAGPNGAGKTTLLACLRRIAHRNAFALHFPSSRQSDRLDNFSTANITYEVGNDSVAYAYAGERWVPRPRANNNLLQRMGYREVLYVGATADRITPRPEDFSLRRVKSPAEAIRVAANEVFQTDKFDGLRIINLSRGSGNAAFLMQTARRTYYSEKNFSLGELCVLKLIRSLQRLTRGSLLLVDELELALHPKVQINLLRYLEDMARQKQLTVIFSTHSVSLIKSVPRSRLLYLENDNGVVTTIKGCYPTYALGGLALGEERAPDVVIYVEDVCAVDVVEGLLRRFREARFGQDHRLFPSVKVTPVGPFMSVVRFLSHGQAMLPEGTRTRAMLDGDVRDETVENWEREDNHERLAEFQAHGDVLNYLPWTPEVGLFHHFISPHREDALRRLRAGFGENRIDIPRSVTQAIPDIQVASGRPLRDGCKNALALLVEHIHGLKPNMSKDAVQTGIFQAFCDHHFEHHRADVMQLMGPIVA